MAALYVSLYAITVSFQKLFTRSKFVCNAFQKCLPEVNLAQNGQLDFLLNINQVLLTTGSNVKIASDLKFRSPGMGWNTR